MEKYVIFHIDGGIGKHIAATAVARCIKNNHPDRKLIVVCAWPMPFINLGFVNRVYSSSNVPYFYQDYIDGKDSLIFKHEPYFTTDHIHGSLPLIENWCKLYNLEYSGEQPEIEFNLREKQLANMLWQSNKPILLLQTAGGLYTDDKGPKYKWTRDMPPSLMQAIYDEFVNHYNIFQVTRPGAVTINGAAVVDKPFSIMELLTLVAKSSKRLLIDSCLQHGAAAMGLKSTVLWVGTNPKIFGYDIHDNIVANQKPEFKLPDSYLFNYNFEGVTHECPYKDESEIFDIDKIIESLKR